MPIVVNTNSAATTASFNLGRSNEALRKSLGPLSSGKRITSPADDVGGFAVALKLTSKANRTSALIFQGIHRARKRNQTEPDPSVRRPSAVQLDEPGGCARSHHGRRHRSGVHQFRQTERARASGRINDRTGEPTYQHSADLARIVPNSPYI